jgi:ParB family chromosome partitioning protein
MTTTAGNAAAHSEEKGKEKAEKRRALGRGLESLLGGPRVVRTQAPPLAQSANDGATNEATRAEAPSTIARGGSVPHEEAASTADLHQPEPAVVPKIQAVAEEEWDQAAGEPVPVSGITLMAQAESRIPGNLVVNLAIEDIDKNPFQTRYVDNDDALEELTNSIKANGVLQPILVRPSEEEGRYTLILGERRMHAAKLAGKTAIPAIVRRVSEQQAAEMTIIENLQREDLSALEQAEAFRLLSEEFNLTQAQIGERVGLSRESVANYMRLLKLPREVMQLLAEKRINFAQARELLKLENNDKIAEAALYAVKKGLTVEQVERLVLQMNGWLNSFPGMPGQERKKGGARWVDPNVKAAQFDLERLLGVRVRIRDRKGKGKIIIEYSTVNDYERVVGMLRGKK